MHWDMTTRYQILLKINNAVISKNSREDLFQALSTELRRHIKYDRLAINLYDADSESLSYFAAADGIEPLGISSMDSRSLAKGAISRMVIRTGQAVIIDDLSRYTDLSSIKSLVESGLYSTMAFPLTIRSRILGSIHFSFRKKPEHISEMIEVLTDVTNQVAIAVDNMLAYTSLKLINEHLEREKRFLIETTNEYQQEGFFYGSPPMLEIMSLIEQVASTDASILLTGETGTGKEYLARYIHTLSSRRESLFVKVSCPTLSPTLFESELFGHTKGAFTGANSKRIGRFEMANGGTVFLDEIGDLPSDLQAKLLHVLQDRRFERVGDSQPIDISFRVIAATNKDIAAEIQSGNFRQDLYYRLNIVNIHVPPLRERTKDIPLLIEKLSGLEAKKTNRPAPVYTEEALEIMRQYHWPGNVRELKNLVKRMVILRPGETIRDQDINKVIAVAAVSQSAIESSMKTLAEAERYHIERALVESKGVLGGRDGAARLLGIPRSTLQYRLKKFGLKPAHYVQ
jgi:transcriptional regulator with GAF, ATPase, and Fis domain